jgi:hypothetical protein
MQVDVKYRIFEVASKEMITDIYVEGTQSIGPPILKLSADPLEKTKLPYFTGHHSVYVDIHHPA